MINSCFLSHFCMKNLQILKIYIKFYVNLHFDSLNRIEFRRIFLIKRFQFYENKKDDGQWKYFAFNSQSWNIYIIPFLDLHFFSLSNLFFLFHYSYILLLLVFFILFHNLLIHILYSHYNAFNIFPPTFFLILILSPSSVLCNWNWIERSNWVM